MWKTKRWNVNQDIMRVTEQKRIDDEIYNYLIGLLCFLKAVYRTRSMKNSKFVGLYLTLWLLLLHYLITLLHFVLALCPATFIAHPTNRLCYGFIRELADFFSAERSCRSYGLGGMLVKLDEDILLWMKMNVFFITYVI